MHWGISAHCTRSWFGMFCYGIFSGLCGRLSKVKAKVEFGCANARKEPLFFQVKPLNVLFLYIFCSIIWFCCSPLQNVRRVALVTFNSAAHNKPSLIRDLLEQILPQLYNETKVRVCRFKIIFFFFFSPKSPRTPATRLRVYNRRPGTQRHQRDSRR